MYQHDSASDSDDSENEIVGKRFPNSEHIYKAIRQLHNKNPTDPNWLKITAFLNQTDAGPSKKLKLDIPEVSGSKRQDVKQGGSFQKKPRTGPLLDKEQNYGASGLKLTLHGTIYQVKLLMVFVKRAIDQRCHFHLATEMDAADKFDDIVFKFKNDQNNWIYRFVQAKHKLEPKQNKISINDLITTNDENFSIQKYFVSYYKIIHESVFKNGELKDFIICTNTDFDFEINRIFKKDGQETKYSIKSNDLKIKWMNYFNSDNVSPEDKILYFGRGEKNYKFKREKNIKEEVAAFIKSAIEKNAEENKSLFLKNMLNDNNFLKYIHDFLDKLVFITNYPTEEEIEKLIEYELGNEFNLLKADLITDSFEKLMLDWLKCYDKKQAYFFSYSDGLRFFKDITNSIKTLLTIGLGKAHTEGLKNYGISFKSNVEKLKAFLDPKQNSKQICMTVTDTPLLCLIKVYQTIENIKYENNYNYLRAEDSHIIIGLETLMVQTLQAIILNSFSSVGAHHLLVIECEPNKIYDNEQQMKLFEKLKKIFDNTNKRIIIIAQYELNLSRYFKEYDSFTDVISFDQLDDDSQSIILKKIIEFQGDHVELNSLIDKQLATEIIGQSTLLTLVQDGSIKINDDSYSFSTGYEPDYYISRTLHRQEVRKQILNSKESSNNEIGLLFITGISNRESLFKLGAKNEDIYMWTDDEAYKGKIILFNSDKNPLEVFEMLYEKFEMNIHWLEHQDGILIWRNTRGNWAIIRKYIDQSYVPINKNKFQENFFRSKESFQQKIIILANDPGVGKSMILTNVARELKKEYPFLWIVRFNLNDFTKKGKDNWLGNILFSEDDINEAVEFVSKMLTDSDSDNFEQILFKSGLLQDTNSEIVYPQIVYPQILILFDGFDEISPTYKVKVHKLLKCLKKTSIAQLWVTTRVHEKSYLEEELESPALVLNSLTTTEQQEFLNKFWKWSLMFNKTININENCKRSFEEITDLISDFPDPLKSCIIYQGLDNVDFSDYGKILLEGWKKSINDDKDWEFTSVPLNLKMLAEIVFLKKFELPENLELVNVYDEFIKLKFGIYHSEKSKTSEGNVAANTKDSVFCKISRAVHQEIALKLFFPEIVLWKSKIKLFEEPDKTAEEELVRIGLLTLKGNDLQFIHRSFAEYFLSEFLCIRKNLNKRDIQNILFGKILLEDNYALIRKFFNSLLKEKSVSDLILHDEIKVKVVANFEEVDTFTVLHVAAEEGSARTLQFLLNVFLKQRLNLKRLLLTLKKGNCPLHLGARYCEIEVVKVLLQFVNDNFTDILRNFLLLRNSYGFTALHHAANKNFTKMIDILLDFVKRSLPDVFSDIILAADNLVLPENKMRTSLHVAAEEDNCNFIAHLLNTLIKNDTDMCKTLVLKPNRLGETALHTAAAFGHSNSVEVLLNIVRNQFEDILEEFVSHQDFKGETALHLATDYGGTKTVEKLLEPLERYPKILENFVLKCDKFGKNSFDAMTWNAHCEAIIIIFNKLYNQPNLIKKLLIPQTEDGSNLLHWSVMRSQWKVVQTFLQGVQRYPDILEQLVLSCNNSGNTPFSIAYKNNNQEIMKCISENIKSYSYINDKVVHQTNWLEQISEKKRYFKSMVLHEKLDEIYNILQENSDFKIVKELLLQTDSKGKTVLNLAVEHGYCELLDILLKDITTFKELMLSCDSDGKTVLHLAVDNGQAASLQLLLDSVAIYPNILKDLVLQVTGNAEGNNALHLASQIGHYKIVTVLLTKICSLDFFTEFVLQRNHLSRNALHLACWNGYFNVVKELIDKTKDKPDIIQQLVQQRDQFKQTPLYLSAFKKHWNIVEALLNVGADINDLTNEQGRQLKEYIETKGNVSEEIEYMLGGITNVLSIGTEETVVQTAK